MSEPRLRARVHGREGLMTRLEKFLALGVVFSLSFAAGALGFGLAGVVGRDSPPAATHEAVDSTLMWDDGKCWLVERGGTWTRTTPRSMLKRPLDGEGSDD